MDLCYFWGIEESIGKLFWIVNLFRYKWVVMGPPHQLHITAFSNENESQALSPSHNQCNDWRDIEQITVQNQILPFAFVLIL